jgi:M6 family metalloprotease-like protein
MLVRYFMRIVGLPALCATALALILTFGALPASAAVPGAPAIVSTSAGNHQAVVAFTASANGGSAITGYTVTSNPAGGVDSDAGTTALLHTVTGLTNGTVYTFTVTASNAQGTGAASAASFNTTPRIYAPSTGTLNNLVVFIRFSDQPEFSQPLSYYDDLFNLASTSLKNFYLESSYNTLTVNSTFYPAPSAGAVVSYQDSHPTAYYQPYNASTNTLGYQGAQGAARETALVTNALNAVSADIAAAGLNLDGDADGYIDHITFEVYSTDVNPLPVLFYSRATYDTSGSIVTNGKQVGTYTWVTSSQDHPYSASSLGSVEIHEMGHSFGYPDLRGSASRDPVGNWDVMSVSASPVHSGAYEKFRFPHWISSIPEISQYTSYTLNDITQATNNAYKVRLPNTDEFLVLEYRKAAGPFESRLPGSGLCITRVNEAAGIWGNLNGPPFFLYYFRPGGNFSSDGQNANLFKCLNAESGQTQFNDYSNPPCFLSDGSPCGISITNIGSTTGSSITFSLGDPATTIVTHALTGYLAYANGSRVIGATVALSGDSVAETTTDSLGRYVFAVNAGGNYTITPTKANSTLSPASWSYVNVTSDQVHNFAAAKITRTVSGTVTSSGVPVSGASIIIGNCPNGGNYVGSTSTDQNGSYSFILDQGSTCAAWALKTNYSFLPNSRTFTSIAQDEVQDFASNLTTVTLSGKVTSGGSPLAGVTVSCPGATTTPTLTDASGNYTFSVLVGGGSGYTVTPSSGSSSFTPAQRSYTGLVGSQINQDFAVQPAGTTVLTSSANPSLPGQSVSFTASVAGSGGTPTGTVTFNDGGSALCSSVALSGGQAVCTTGVLGAGNRSIVALYSGDGLNSGSISATLTQVVLAAPGAPVIGTASAGNGQAQVSFGAPASDGGSAVTGYTVTSSPAGGVDTGAGTTALSHLVTGLTNGTSYSFSVRATNLAGTGSASAASSAVTPGASQTITFTPPSSATYGDAPIVLAASASSALPVSYSLVSGPATLNGSTLTITGAGTITVKASQAGNGSFATASDVQRSIAVAARPLTVSAANASRAFGAPNPAVPGFTASGLAGGDSIGSVSYAYAASATASASVGSSHSITPSAALFASGSAANYLVSYLPGTLTITGTASQTISFTAQASASYGDAPIVLAASASSALPVTFALVSGPASLAGSTLTITGAGSVTVKASQAGDANYAAAPDQQRTIAVGKAPALVLLTGLSQAYSGREMSVTASTSPHGLPLVITYDGSATAPVTVGSHAVLATIVDGNYQGSASATLEITPFVVPAGSLLGDINGDGVVDVADALKILRIAVGLATVTPQDYLKADVAPLKGGKPFPDGVVDIADALIVLEKSVGLISW